jgi:hypothetical protein
MIQLRLWLIEVPCHDDVRGTHVWHHTVLISAIDSGEQSASGSGRFNLSDHHTEDLVNTTVSPEGNETLTLRPELNLNHAV